MYTHTFFCLDTSPEELLAAYELNIPINDKSLLNILSGQDYQLRPFVPAQFIWKYDMDK